MFSTEDLHLLLSENAQKAVMKGIFSSQSPQGYDINVLRSGLQKACRRGDSRLMLKCMMEMLAFGKHPKGQGIVSNLANRLRVILLEDCVVPWAVVRQCLDAISAMVGYQDDIVMQNIIALRIANAMCAFPKGRLLSHLRAVFGPGWHSDTVRAAHPEVYSQYGDCNRTDADHNVSDVTSFQRLFRNGQLSCLVPLLQLSRRVEAFQWVASIASCDEQVNMVKELNQIAAKISRWQDQMICALSAVVRCGPWFHTLFGNSKLSDEDKWWMAEKDGPSLTLLGEVLSTSFVAELTDTSIVDVHCREGRQRGADALAFALSGAVVHGTHPDMMRDPIFKSYEAIYVQTKALSLALAPAKAWKAFDTNWLKKARTLCWATDFTDASVPTRKVCGKKPIVVLATAADGSRVALKKLNQMAYGFTAMCLHRWCENMHCASLKCEIIHLDVDLRRVDESVSEVAGNWAAYPSARRVPYLCMEAFQQSHPLSQESASSSWKHSPILVRQYAAIGLFAYLFGVSDFNTSNVLCQPESETLMPIDRMEMLKDVEFMGRVCAKMRAQILEHRQYLKQLLVSWVDCIASGKAFIGSEHFFSDQQDLKRVQALVIHRCKKAQLLLGY